MTLGISSFQVNPRNQYADMMTWGHVIIQGIADSLVAANSSISIEDILSPAGNFTESSYYANCTIGLYNSLTSEHIRIWVYTNLSTANINSTAGVSTSNSSCRIYKGNLCSQGASQNKYYCSGLGIVIGVSDNSIDRDTAKDLGLKCPLIQMMRYCYSNNESSYYIETGSLESYKTKFTITSDGESIGIFMHCNSTDYPTSCSAIIYHNQMFQTASGDNETAGAVCFGNSSNYFPRDINTIFWLGNNAAGQFSYGQYMGRAIQQNPVAVSPVGNLVSCVPITFYAYADPYASSTSDLIQNGIGFKGYSNQNLFRYCSPDKVTNIGAVYGGWLCIGKGWLIPWETGHDTDSPFVIL